MLKQDTRQSCYLNLKEYLNILDKKENKKAKSRVKLSNDFNEKNIYGMYKQQIRTVQSKNFCKKRYTLFKRKLQILRGRTRIPKAME